MQSAGLYDVWIKDLDTSTEKYLGETPQDGAFVFSMAETTQTFMARGAGNLPTEARTIVGPATLTIDLILERGLEQFISSGLYAESATKSIYGTGHNCEKKTFEVRLHPKCNNIATKTDDIKFLKAYFDKTTEITATDDGKKLIKTVINAMNVETTLGTPTTPTITAGSGSANALYWVAIATNGSGVSLASAEVSSTVDDDTINFTLPMGATGMTLYAGEATGPATNIKYWEVTDAEITAGKVEDIGTLYDSGDMTTATEVPSSATGFFYKSIELGN